MNTVNGYRENGEDFVCTCPKCGHENEMYDIDREEKDILIDGGEIHYWCQHCDNEMIVIGN